MLKVGLRLSQPLVSKADYTISGGVLLAGRPHVLTIHPETKVVTVLTSATWAEDVSRGGPQAKVRFAHDVLRDAFGSSAVSLVAASAYSSWDEEPLARGAYSTALPGRAAARGIYDEIVDGKLIFAGEAAVGSQATTVGGAWLSGERAAMLAAGG
jgi:monoamine oxidase